MRIPKLKYYYYALNETDYQEFERTRRVVPNSKTTLNLATGTMTTTEPFLYFYARPAVADTRYRQLNRYQHHPVWVLRIPADLVNRGRLTPAPDPEGMWIYSDPISIPHCAVERFELAPETEVVTTQIIAKSGQASMISIPIT
jgi:hypothetical protein